MSKTIDRVYARYLPTVELPESAVTVMLVGTMALVQLVVLFAAFALSHSTVGGQLAHSVVSNPVYGTGGSQSTDTGAQAIGSGSSANILRIAALVVVESGILIGLYKVWQQFSERTRKLLRLVFSGGIKLLALACAGYVALLSFYTGILIFCVLATIILIPDWLLADFIGLLAAIGIGLMFGLTFNPWLVTALLVGLLIYDFIAVHESGHMQLLAKAAIDWGLPAIVVLPRRLPLDMADVRDAMLDDSESGDEDDKSDSEDETNELVNVFLIGTGDYAVPSILTGSVAVAFQQHFVWLFGIPVPVVGACVVLGVLASVFVIQSEFFQQMEWKAGLPFLNTGAIIGFLVGITITGEVIQVIAGVIPA